jgi:hypothetical protein
MNGWRLPTERRTKQADSNRNSQTIMHSKIENRHKYGSYLQAPLLLSHASIGIWSSNASRGSFGHCDKVGLSSEIETHAS